jgi:hypothetical protein
MSSPSPGLEVPSGCVRTPSTGLVVGSCCLVCRRDLPPGSRSNRLTCSTVCRRELSRRRQAEALAARDRDLLARLDQAEGLLQRAAELLQGARRRVEETS